MVYLPLMLSDPNESEDSDGDGIGNNEEKRGLILTILTVIQMVLMTMQRLPMVQIRRMKIRMEMA